MMVVVVSISNYASFTRWSLCIHSFIHSVHRNVLRAYYVTSINSTRGIESNYGFCPQTRLGTTKFANTLALSTEIARKHCPDIKLFLIPI